MCLFALIQPVEAINKTVLNNNALTFRDGAVGWKVEEDTTTLIATGDLKTYRHNQVPSLISVDEYYTKAGDFVSSFSSTANFKTLMTGVIMSFAYEPPTTNGWLSCDGSTVSQNTHAALYAKIGTRWGPTANNDTEFTLPDLRGLFLVGTNSDSVGASPLNIGGYSETST